MTRVDEQIETRYSVGYSVMLMAIRESKDYLVIEVAYQRDSIYIYTSLLSSAVRQFIHIAPILPQG